MAVSQTLYAQNVHQHSDCLEDSINPMKEAILSEVTVQGIAGVQRLKDAASPFMVVSPKQLHASLGTKSGTVRFAPSVFNTASETLKLAEAVRSMKKI